MGKLLFERGGRATHHAKPADSKKRTHLHLLGIMGAIVGITAAVGIILVFSHAKVEKPIQIPPKIIEQPRQLQSDRPLCTNEGTSLFCMCSSERDILGTCSEKHQSESAFYTASTANGNIIGTYISSEFWSCKWQNMDAFAHFVPAQNLCGNTEAQAKSCKEAATLKPDCIVTYEERQAIDKELQKCVEKAKTICKGTSESSDVNSYDDVESLAGGSI